jgi:hypothetical protein
MKVVADTAAAMQVRAFYRRGALWRLVPVAPVKPMVRPDG